MNIRIFPWQTLYVLLLRLIGQASACPIRCLLSLTARNNRKAELCRSLVAQSVLVERDDEQGLCLWKMPDGLYWMPDRSLSQEALADMIAEEMLDQYGGAKYGVRTGDIVLDCGANVGVFTRRALQAGAAAVLAVEASPANASALKRNLSAEIEAGRVIVYTGAVWSHETVLEMNMGDSPAGDSVLPAQSRNRRAGSQVPATTIDQLVQQFQLKAVDFIKMDIEGAERHALLGGLETIGRCTPHMALSVYHLPDDPHTVRALIGRVPAGYRFACESCLLHFNGYLHSRVSPEVYFFTPAARPR